MKTIAVMTPKGGVGKTTTVVSLAKALEEKGKKVLIVDGDMQGDASRVFGAYQPGYCGVAKLMEDHRGLWESEVYSCSTEDETQDSRVENIRVICGNSYLLQTSAKLMLKEDNPNQTNRMQIILREVESQYDYCLCDCAKFLDMVTINILVAADLLIVPVKCGGYEINALENLMEDISTIQDLNENIQVKILMTMWQKNKLANEEKEWLLNKSGYDVIKTPVRRSVVVEKAALANVTPLEMAKNGIVAQDYREVLKEIE